ncbi:MAG: hypothetical protein ACOVLD_03030 [Bacteroidia bacterium]|jgi:hypothetical protein
MSLEYPETGMDYVFKLLPKEWEFLGTIWDDQSDEWKESITYYAGCVRVKESYPIINKALKEDNKDIEKQILLALHKSLKEEFLTEKKLEKALSDAEIQFVLGLIEDILVTPKRHTEMRELKAMLEMFDKSKLN